VVLRNDTLSSRMVDEIVDISRPPDGSSGVSNPTEVFLRNNTSSSRMVDEIVDISRPSDVRLSNIDEQQSAATSSQVVRQLRTQRRESASARVQWCTTEHRI